MLQINHGYQLLADQFPVNSNIFIPMITLGFDSVAVATGISTPDVDQGARLFPNPARDFFDFTSVNPVLEIEITNCFGETVLMQKPTQALHDRMNVSSLPAGIYFARIVTAGKYSMVKFVKE